MYVSAAFKKSSSSSYPFCRKFFNFRNQPVLKKNNLKEKRDKLMILLILVSFVDKNKIFVSPTSGSNCTSKSIFFLFPCFKFLSLSALGGKYHERRPCGNLLSSRQFSTPAPSPGTRWVCLYSKSIADWFSTNKLLWTLSVLVYSGAISISGALFTSSLQLSKLSSSQTLP